MPSDSADFELGRPKRPPLAYGPGKVLKMNAFSEQQGVVLKDAIFYSDSITDLPLFEQVGTPVAINPDERLARIARQRSWRVEHWR